jgi:hypothetical protein
VNRRGFLSLLVASASVPALAKLPGLLPEPERALELVAPGDAGELAELVGNVERPRLTRERLLEMNRKAIEAAPVVRRAVLPFGPEGGDSPIIGAGRIGRLVAMPQAPFQAERLVTLEGFDLLGLSVGGEPVLDEFLPSELFMPGAIPTELRFHMTRPGDLIVMVVRNRGPSRRLGTALVGSTL